MFIVVLCNDQSSEIFEIEDSKMEVVLKLLDKMVDNKEINEYSLVNKGHGRTYHNYGQFIKWVARTHLDL